MSILTGTTQTTPLERVAVNAGYHLNNGWQKVAVSAWFLLLVISLLSCVLSKTNLNTWDRVPALDLPQYFPDTTQEVIGIWTTFQNEVLGLGFSLPAFANLLSAFRLIVRDRLFVLSKSRPLIHGEVVSFDVTSGSGNWSTNTLLTFQACMSFIILEVSNV